MSFAFESLMDFIAMGGYAFNVWLSFGITLGSMIILTGVIWSQDKSTERLVKRQARLTTQKEIPHKSKE